MFPGFVPAAVLAKPAGPVVPMGRPVQVMPVSSTPPSSPAPAVSLPGAAVILPLQPQQKGAAQLVQQSPSHSPQPQLQPAAPAVGAATGSAAAGPQQMSARVFHHTRSRSEGWRQHVVIGGPPCGSPLATTRQVPAIFEASPVSAAQTNGTSAAGQASRDVSKAVVAGRTFVLDGILGKGSFGVVYCAYEEDSTTDGKPVEAAVKEIRCRSEKERKQAEYEAALMKRLSSERIGNANSTRPLSMDSDGSHGGSGPSSQSHRRLCCPALLAHQSVATAPNNWTVMIAMERVPGIPLDDFTKDTKLSYQEGVALCRELLEQLCPTLERVAPHCVHRDINAHNIMLHAPVTPSTASETGPRDDRPAISDNKPRFTLIDFGLATETTSWRTGDWKSKDIGGDCRYWPVSSWKLFMFGFRYLLQDTQVANEYLYNLDVHSLVLTCVQLLVEVAGGKFPDCAAVLEKAWSKYWEDALRFWKQLYACFKSRAGDWNALKCAFTQQQVVDTTERNLKALRAALSACANAEGEAASTSALFRTLSRMLGGEVVEWSELTRVLNSTEKSGAALEEGVKSVAPARKFVHHRTRTLDQTMTRDVPDIGAARLRADVCGMSSSPEKSRAPRASAVVTPSQVEPCLSPDKRRMSMPPPQTHQVRGGGAAAGQVPLTAVAEATTAAQQQAALIARANSASPSPPTARLAHVRVGSADTALGSLSSSAATIRGGPGDERRLLNFGAAHCQSHAAMRVRPIRKVTEEDSDLMKYMED